MGESQLLLEGKLYELSQENLVPVMEYLKMENSVMLGEAKRKTIQRIQTEIESQAAGEDAEALLLGLQRLLWKICHYWRVMMRQLVRKMQIY